MTKILYIPDGRFISFAFLVENISQLTFNIEESIMWNNYIEAIPYYKTASFKDFLSWLFIDTTKMDYNGSFYIRNNLKYSDNLSLSMFELVYV